MARYYIGTSGWHYGDWRSRFYPEKLSRVKWLEYYARHFDTVELNNSFYRLPSESAFGNWYSSTPDDFIFAVKVSRFITHVKRLQNSGEAVANFLQRARVLGEKLGPLLYQLPPNLPYNGGILESFLSGLPGGFRHVIEFRHQSWLVEDVFRILRKYHAGFCVFNMPAITCPLRATTDFAYIRFHGRDGLYSSLYPDEELAEWARGITNLAAGLDTVYIYFNNDIEGFALRNAVTMRNYLEKER